LKTIRVILWILVALYALAIFVVSSLRAPIPAEFSERNWDKALHAVEFFGFGLLLYLAFRSSFSQRSAAWCFAAALLVGSFYGMTDEFHQRFVPTRCSDIHDAAADMTGSAIGAGLALTIRKGNKNAGN